MFLNLFCCRDREKFVWLLKEVDELKLEVKKLRRRVCLFEKKKEIGDLLKNFIDDEVLDILYVGLINLLELISFCKKFIKVLDVVVFLFNFFFFKNEIKNFFIFGKRIIKCR